MNRAVFLDRDGVINRAVIRGGRPYPPAGPEDFEILPGVPEAVDALRAAGFLVIVVTNQPDVASGVQQRAVVEVLHDRLRTQVAIDALKVCYHVDDDQCGCRKPEPGMLLEAACEWSIDLGRSFMVGDRWRDVGAGRAAGCVTLRIGDGYGERQGFEPDAVVASLREAGDWILSEQRRAEPGERDEAAD